MTFRDTLCGCICLVAYCFCSAKGNSIGWDAVSTNWKECPYFSISVINKCNVKKNFVSFSNHLTICNRAALSKVEVRVVPIQKECTINKRFLHLKLEKLTFYKSEECLRSIWKPYSYRNFLLRWHNQELPFFKTITILPPPLRGGKCSKGVYRVLLGVGGKLNVDQKYIIVL